MGSIVEFDSSYPNTNAGKFKMSCLALGGIGIIVHWLTTSGRIPAYYSPASSAWVVTLVLLLVLMFLSGLRRLSWWLLIEFIICCILIFGYFFASWSIISVCWDAIVSRGSKDLILIIGSLVTSICSVLCTLTYISDAVTKFREVFGGGSTSNV